MQTKTSEPQDQHETWPQNLPPESRAFLTGRYNRRIERLAQRVAISRARETRATTQKLYLRVLDASGEHFVSDKPSAAKVYHRTETQYFTLSDGKTYTISDIARLTGITRIAARDRVKDGCRCAKTVLRRKASHAKKAL